MGGRILFYTVLKRTGEVELRFGTGGVNEILEAPNSLETSKHSPSQGGSCGLLVLTADTPRPEATPPRPEATPPRPEATPPRRVATPLPESMPYASL